RSSDFRRGAHQLIFEAISSLANRNMPVDPVMVADELDKHHNLSKVGGALTLHELISQVPTAVNVGHYISQVREASVTGHTISAADRIKQVMAARHVDLDERVDAARSILDEATRLHASTSTASSVADVVGPLLDRLDAGEPIAGVTTGWADLDNLLTRLRPGQLIIVGARPGMGKSVVMINVATHVRHKLGEPVLFASLEMSKDEVALRMIASLGRVSLTSLQKGDLDDQAWSNVARAQAQLAEYTDLIIDDNPSMTIAHLSAAIRRMRRNGMMPALVVVDYLQLMTSGKRTESRQVEVSELSRSLKKLAGEFGIPVMVGCQLNRGPEQRANKRPSKADLRESGSLEQDSDIVILLHREDAYEPETPRAGEIELIVDKHRQGPTATITLAWQPHYARAVDFAPEPSDERPNLHAVK
ncbi:replicative DNA helicase, partial [Nonomuraea pusilla]